MKQTFVKAAIMASFMAAVSCGQAPTEQGPAQYGVTTIATTDREIQINYSATIRGRQDIAIYPQVSGTISELRVTEGPVGIERTNAFHHRPGTLQGSAPDSRSQCRSGKGQRGNGPADI